MRLFGTRLKEHQDFFSQVKKEILICQSTRAIPSMQLCENIPKLWPVICDAIKGFVFSFA